MNKKFFQFLILLAILAIPVIIFLFLKSFGNNQFDIPVYYANGASRDFKECTYQSDPFKVPIENGNDKKANLTLFFDDSEQFTATNLINAQSRLETLFPEDLSFITYELDTADDSGELIKLMHCGFVTDTVNQFILHDQYGRIRGYYNTELEELDRLIVEIKILLENE
ncbi:MAG: hypothetical protein AAGF85_08770 [Bacteroidota bacterium]